MLPGFGKYPFGYQPFGQPQKPRLFISYHHADDQRWCDAFRQYFGNTYDLFTDNSLLRKINSDDAEYIDRKVRDEYITGSSITVVLCGPNTWKRKFVDWEIHATLDKQHALLGIILPHNAPNSTGNYVVPARLHDNIQSGYAHWIKWTTDPNEIAKSITQSKDMAKEISKIENSREQMKRNLP